MKFFTNKSIWSKIIIVLIFVLLFEFVVAKPTLADGEGVNTGIEFAGKLMSPILSLVVTLGDAVMEVMQSSIMGTDESLLEADLAAGWYDLLGLIVKAVVLIGCFIAFPAATTIAVIANFIAANTIGVDLIGTIGSKLYDGLADTVGISAVQTASFVEENLPETLYLPAYTLTPEEIFKGNVLMFNVDFFGEPKEILEHTTDVTDDSGNVTGQEIDYYYYYDDEGNEVKTSKQDIGAQLSGTISKWYVSIRNIALVCMMIVLLYIAIRMLLSTLASDKAKYKQMIQDWLVGMLILFSAHYIMAFSVTIVQQLVKIVSTSVDSNTYTVVIPNDSNDKLIDFIKEAGMEEFIYDSNGQNANATGTDAYIMYPTNMMGYLRLRLQLSNWGSEFVGLSLCFVVLVIFTAFFVFTYLKRVLYMAFLTLIAPVVALTYPIDKINDGSAQGFTKWFREYIFNLLIQPMHLLLYFILISTAFELSSENVIYSLVAIGFMLPAEKLLRSLFGFEKASTPGILNGVAGAGLIMGGVSKLSSLTGKGRALNSGNSKDNSSSDSVTSTKAVRFNNGVDATAVMAATTGGNERRIEPTQQGSNNNNDNNNNNNEREEIPVAPGQTQLDFGNDGNDKNEEKQSIKMQEKGQEPSQEEKIEQPTQPIRTVNTEDNDSIEDMEKKLDELKTQKYSDDYKKKEIKGYRSKKIQEKAMKFRLNTHDRLVNDFKKLPGKTIRFAGGAAGAVAAGAVGIAAGISTGDPSDVFQYGAAGAGVGYLAGKSTTSGVASRVDNSKAMQPIDSSSYYRRLMNSEGHRDIAAMEEIKSKREEYAEKLRVNGFEDKEIKRMEKDGTLNRYIENDINVDNAVAAEMMRKENPKITQEQAIADVKYSDRVGDGYKGPERKKWREHFSEEFYEKAGLPKTQADKASKETLKRIDRLNKYKKNVL